MTRPADVLVVGAGPTGLSLALQAHAHGARVRVVERRAEQFRPSRALIVHPRTLEVLRPLGVVDALLAHADAAPRARLNLGGRIVPVGFDDLGLGDTAYPHLCLIRQMDVETVLAGILEERDVPVARSTELADLRPAARRASGTRAVLRTGAGRREVTSDFVVGCDGAESTVRTLAGIEWRALPYRQEVLLADLELDGDLAPGTLHGVAGRDGLVFLFAMGEQAAWRLLATRPGTTSDEVSDPTIREIQQLLDGASLDARVTRMPWSARFRLRRGLAGRYRSGTVFLAGDAAHTHSPAGGQGMNAGIQDAANLGWKLAFAPYSTGPALLQSYVDERRPVARQVQAMTDAIFWAESSTDPVASFLRATVAPLGAPAIPLVLRQRRLVARAIRLLSQFDVAYRRSPLSWQGGPGPPGWPRPGRRLPDRGVVYDGRRTSLHELTAEPGVHIMLLRDTAEPEPALRGRHLHVHRLSTISGTGVVAVRPDGYVGFRSSILDSALLRWLDVVGATGEGSP